MRSRALRNVSERLLRSGIAPRHVNRYVSELQDHLSDSIAQKQSMGMPLADAEEKALLMLGNDTELVQAMIDRGPARSLAARAPWLAFVLLPIFMLVIVTILLSIASQLLFEPFRELPGAAIPQLAHVMASLITLLGSYCAGPMLAAICVAMSIRQRLTSTWVWVGIALIACACGPIGVHIDLPQTGGVHGSAIHAVNGAGFVDLTSTWMMIAVRTLTLFSIAALALLIARRRIDHSTV